MRRHLEGPFYPECFHMCVRAMSKSSMHEKRAHPMYLVKPSVVGLFTKLMVRLKSNAVMEQPCLSPVFTLKLVLLLCTVL